MLALVPNQPRNSMKWLTSYDKLENKKNHMFENHIKNHVKSSTHPTWSLYSSALAAELEELELAAGSMEGSTWLPSLISKSFCKGTSAWHRQIQKCCLNVSSFFQNPSNFAHISVSSSCFSPSGRQSSATVARRCCWDIRRCTCLLGQKSWQVPSNKTKNIKEPWIATSTV